MLFGKKARQSKLVSAVWRWLFRIEIHGGRVLEVGAGKDPKYNKFVKADQYIKLDLVNHPGIDLQGDAMQLPFKDKSFDIAILHEVSCCYDNGYKATMITELKRVAHVVYVRELRQCLWKKINMVPVIDQLPEGSRNG